MGLDSPTDISSSPQPAFFRLPEEILTLLVGQYVRVHVDIEHGESIALRALRCIHPRFAFLPSLCKWLFRFVVLTPDPDREQLQDWSFIGPFVREVYLEPLILTDPDLPWLDQEARNNARRALKPYQQHIDCGRAAIDLTRILKTLIKLRTVFIMSNAKDSQVTFPVVGHFITFATQCLHSAGIEPEQLDLRNVGIRELWSMAHLVSWISSPIYAELHLSNLRLLNVELQNSSIPNNSQVAFGRIAQALCTILDKCKDSLEVLSIATHTAVLWHSPAVAPRMTKLKSLRLDDCKIEAVSFANWLVACDELTNVALADTALLDPDSQHGLVAWRPVFDVLRTHPRRILLEVEDLNVVFDHGIYPSEMNVLPEPVISLTHDTSQLTLECDEVDGNDAPEWPGVKAMLKGYMSGTQDWDLAPGW